MAIQRSKLLGDQYYGNTNIPLVAPPIQARQALMAKKEQDYLITRKSANELDKMMRTMPYLSQSSDIYNQFKSKVEQGLSGVDSTNYEDNVLNVDQLANDAVNKFGGAELKQQYDQLQAANATYDEAQQKGKIVDPEMTQWYKNQTKANVKGLTKDEKGYISRPNVSPVPFAEYVDMQKVLDDQLKGWEADNTITKNADGSVRVNKQIPGYLDYMETESVDPADIMRAANNYLKNDGKTQAYLNDKARFDTRNVQPTAENVLSFMSPEVRKEILGGEGAGVEVVNEKISNGELNPSQFIIDATKSRLIQNNSLVSADKYGYSKEKMTTLSDTMLLESLKAQQAINKAKAAVIKPTVDSNAFVSVEPFKTQQVVNPNDIKALGITRNKAVVERSNLQRQIYSYQKALNSPANKINADGTPSYSKERLDELNMQMEGLDNEISNMEEDSRSLSKTMFANASKAGYDLEKDYTDHYQANREAAIKENTNKILRSSTGDAKNQTAANLDVTNLVKVKNGKASIMIQGKEFDGMLKKVGDKYISQSYSLVLKEYSNVFFNPDGTPSDKVMMSDSDRKSAVAVPDKYQYGQMLVNAYNDGKDGKTFIGTNADNIKSENGKYVVRKEIGDTLGKIREKQGDFEWTLGTPLTYLAVTGETTKESLRLFNNMEKQKGASFKATPDQYKIQTDKGISELGDYLKEEMGIPNLSATYIDWDKTNIRTLSQHDRKYGQKSGINIVLTPDGLDELNSAGKKNYTASNSIKLVGVNPDKNTQAGRAELQSTMLKAYTSASADDTSHGKAMRKEMGIVYLDNSEDGRRLNNLNLYTMSGGDRKTWAVDNRDGTSTDYTIGAISKDAEKSDLLNVDYYLEQGGKVYATNADGGKGWYNAKDVERDGSLKRFTFNSPSDIKAMVGGTLLDTDSKMRKQTSEPSDQEVNVFSSFMNSDSYRTIGTGNGVQATGYSKVVNSVKTTYKAAPTVISVTKGSTGKTVNIESRVPKKDLYDLTETYSSRVSGDVSFPLVNVNAVPYVESVLDENPNVVITGGFRGEKTHQGLADSAENSLHKYGYALDLRDDEAGRAFLDKVVKSNELKQKYGIISVMKHGSTPHIHLEFNPSTI